MPQITVYASMQTPESLKELLTPALMESGYAITVQGENLHIKSRKLFARDKTALQIITKISSDSLFDAKTNALATRIGELPHDDEDTLMKLRLQASLANTVIQMDESSSALTSTLLNVLKGLALSDSGAILNHKGELVYTAAGKRTDADFTVFAAENMVNLPYGKESQKSLARKQASIAKLKERGISVLESLPVLPDAEQAALRSKDEICERAAALLLLIQYACDVAQSGDLKQSRETVTGLLKQYEVLDCLTPKEQEFFYMDNPAMQDAVNFTWQYEALTVLLWALGYADSLPWPHETCDCNAAIAALAGQECYDDFYDNAQLRPKEEILDEADLIYRLDWAAVDARLHKQSLPDDIKSGIVMERHRAFNWLICYQDTGWDDVTMDT